MISPEIFERHTFRVKAVRITHENIEDVAKWCGGTLQRPYKRPEFVEVFCGHKKYDRAYNGDWITCLEGGGSFRVYRNQVFCQAYMPVSNSDDEARSRLNMIMMEALMTDPGSCLHVISELSTKYTELVVEILSGAKK